MVFALGIRRGKKCNYPFLILLIKACGSLFIMVFDVLAALNNNTDWRVKIKSSKEINIFIYLRSRITDARLLQNHKTLICNTYLLNYLTHSRPSRSPCFSCLRSVLRPRNVTLATSLSIPAITPWTVPS
jgi:hypothetical protein